MFGPTGNPQARNLFAIISHSAAPRRAAPRRADAVRHRAGALCLPVT